MKNGERIRGKNLQFDFYSLTGALVQKKRTKEEKGIIIFTVVICQVWRPDPAVIIPDPAVIIP
ncbi:MAG: hypothetical protein DDT32_02060 [Syntrophomonadaceae bacterium]|nr:hypothetical protein [Bacillota bacterium]